MEKRFIFMVLVIRSVMWQRRKLMIIKKLMVLTFISDFYMAIGKMGEVTINLMHHSPFKSYSKKKWTIGLLAISINVKPSIQNHILFIQAIFKGDIEKNVGKRVVIRYICTVLEKQN